MESRLNFPNYPLGRQIFAPGKPWCIFYAGVSGIGNDCELQIKLMENHLSSDQYYNTWVLLRQTRDAIFRAREKELTPYGISTREAGVLFVIQAIGKEATPAEISRWLFREPHTVSALISRMEKKGLIRKANDFPRKNWIRVRLTDKGKEAYNNSTKRQSLHKVLSAFSDEELKQLSSYLMTLRGEAIKELRKEPRIDYTLPFPPNDTI